MKNLQAPFPWFGGKSRIAPVVWERLGDVPSYVEPFFGSGAVLLGRPHEPNTETVNDLDCYVANFWRATQADPEAVAFHASNPVNENDLHARHSWLTERKHEHYRPRIEGDPDYFDAKAAGWWCWGLCCWIGSGFCSGSGPWGTVEGEDGSRKLVHLGDKGQGVNRKLVHLGDKGRGVNRKRVHLPKLNVRGVGADRHAKGATVLDWILALRDRLARVRVCCGDWSRVCGETPTVKVGSPCGVFLDPPYADTASRTSDLYSEDDLSVAHDVREWAIANGDDPRFRIVLAGYDGEHEMPESWEVVEWKARGGYGSQGADTAGRDNANRERLWCSPHCISPVRERGLFDLQEAFA